MRGMAPRVRHPSRERIRATSAPASRRTHRRRRHGPLPTLAGTVVICGAEGMLDEIAAGKAYCATRAAVLSRRLEPPDDQVVERLVVALDAGR